MNNIIHPSNMTLYAAGCSVTWGQGLVNGFTHYQLENDPTAISLRERLAWPGITQRLLGFGNHYNDSRTGASNTLIARNVIDFVNHNNCENVYVVVAWSGASRWELWNKNRSQSMFLTRPPVDSWVGDNKDVSRLWQYAFDSVCKDYTMVDMFHKALIITLQKFLEQRNVRYYMVHGVDDRLPNVEPSPLLKLVNTSTFPDVDVPRTDFRSQILDTYGNHPKHFVDGSHPACYGLIAAKITEHIENDLYHR